jgi:hypothetical protein
VSSVAREEESIALAAVSDADASGIEEGYEVKWNKNFFFIDVLLRREMCDCDKNKKTNYKM